MDRSRAEIVTRAGRAFAGYWLGHGAPVTPRTYVMLGVEPSELLSASFSPIPTSSQFRPYDIHVLYNIRLASGQFVS